MKIKAIALAALSVASIGLAHAADKSDWTLTGNAGLFSDYRFRGFTQTDYKPAFQGGFDLAHSSGLYVGNWNSNVEQDLYRGASLEMDLYGGYKTTVGDVALDFGGLYYAYPNSRASIKPTKQFELYAGATYGEFSAKFSYGLTNFFGSGDVDGIKTDGNYYIDLGYARDLGDGLGVNAHYGYQYIKNGTAVGLSADNVSDYRVGLTKDFGGWVAGASLVATSKKDFFTNGTLTKGAGRTSAVLSLSKAF